MRHFASGGYHIAAATVIREGGDFSRFGTELPEGDDGKCDWCRAADERWEKMAGMDGETA